MGQNRDQEKISSWNRIQGVKISRIRYLESRIRIRDYGVNKEGTQNKNLPVVRIQLGVNIIRRPH
jgi:hypothetical protein